MAQPDTANPGEALARADLEAQVMQASREIYTKAYSIIDSKIGINEYDADPQWVRKLKGRVLVSISAHQSIPDFYLDDNGSFSQVDNHIGTVAIQLEMLGDDNTFVPDSDISVNRYIVEPKQLKKFNRLSREQKASSDLKVGKLWQTAQNDLSVGAFGTRFPFTGEAGSGYDDLEENPEMPEGRSMDELTARLIKLRSISELLG